jgi:hypothetical protein
MRPVRVVRFALALTLCVAGAPWHAYAQAAATLPSPLNLVDVNRIAADRRDEIQAARARIRAGEARHVGSIVSIADSDSTGTGVCHGDRRPALTARP